MTSRTENNPWLLSDIILAYYDIIGHQSYVQIDQLCWRCKFVIINFFHTFGHKLTLKLIWNYILTILTVKLETLIWAELYQNKKIYPRCSLHLLLPECSACREFWGRRRSVYNVKYRECSFLVVFDEVMQVKAPPGGSCWSAASVSVKVSRTQRTDNNICPMLVGGIS